ncbi:MAG: hypothetical protein QM817_18860 [Archangium sp.]
MSFRSAALFVALLSSGCATARLVGEKAPFAPDPGVQRTVIVEPFFELAELVTTTQTRYLSTNPYSMGSFGGFNTFGPSTGGSVPITTQITEKPFIARPSTLVQLQTRILAEVQRRRPSWRVTSTGGAPLLKGDVTIVRTVIQGYELVESDRTLKNLAFGFGLVIIPLQFVNIDPVHETDRFYGLLERFSVDANLLGTRMVKYPTQPDYAVNLAGVPSVRHEFGLDVAYEEGLLADEKPRSGVLIEGFVDRLASAVIAIVEEPTAP